MNKLRTAIISIATLIAATLFPATLAFAQGTGTGGGTGQDCASPVECLQKGSDNVNGAGAGGGLKLEDGIKTVVNVLLFVLGAIAVIMIIIGGIRYSTSNGDANATKSAKDTILYAVIGLIVAILAYAIVNFVLGAFKGGQ
jgi:hypothetical protein